VQVGASAERLAPKKSNTLFLAPLVPSVLTQRIFFEETTLPHCRDKQRSCKTGNQFAPRFLTNTDAAEVEETERFDPRFWARKHRQNLS
jgi:hypothetical protein